MKKIEAIIRRQKLDEVKDRLAARVISAMTVTDVRGYGRQRGNVESYRGNEYRPVGDLLPKVKVEIVVADNYLSTVLEVIASAARTGKMGDGKIFVSEVSNVVRIRTGETNELAI